jgi:hypothetical protein
VKVHASALKRGIDPEDAIRAASSTVFISDLDDDAPRREMRLGFDRSGRLLELGLLVFDSGNELTIRAMKARRQYLDLLE